STLVTFTAYRGLSIIHEYRRGSVMTV
ncbi:unnamed protein product, partial [Allacma fusca]